MNTISFLKKTFHKYTFLKHIGSAIFASSLLVAGAHAGQVEIDQVETAAAQLDIASLQQLSISLQGYDLALAQYRLALSANLSGQEAIAKDAINKAMDILETLDETSPNNVEVKALLAQVYGYKVAIQPFKGMFYGPKSQAKLKEAESLSSDNPRVLLVKGIGAANTPPMFGGSKEVAIASFTSALEQFESDQFSNFYWGHAETYTWLGLVHMQEGETEQALAYYDKALEVQPDYGWAKALIADTQK